ncbi:isopentenyl-diphosphate Delta-isomerase 1-like [Zophobas morio]|uniref:isopentenyl-diphosphate Delta-isomerase 1-like n=1 Tax=Zophobas morio TaxID=2755281 RepID=UPI00308282EE
MLTLPFRNLITKTAKRTLQTNLLIRAKSTKEEPNESQKLQEAALNENLFLVDDNDTVVGRASKRECHQVGKCGGIPLHRAFSVFLFTSHGDLLLQKRASEKITYPDQYTNSCCSHPVADIPGEDEEKDALGVKRAAQRRLNHELGIPTDKLPLEQFTYLTRVHYKDEGDGQWGEHEIDYVLFFRGDVPVKPNPNEISEISFVPRGDLDQHIPTLGTLTPWFYLILKNRLKLWWDNLDNLDKFKDHHNILKLGGAKKN